MLPTTGTSKGDCFILRPKETISCVPRKKTVLTVDQTSTCDTCKDFPANLITFLDLPSEITKITHKYLIDENSYLSTRKESRMLQSITGDACLER